MTIEDIKAAVAEGVGMTRERTIFVNKIRSLADCFLPAFDAGIVDNDYRIYWQCPTDPTMIRPIVGPSEIGAIKAAAGVGKSTFMNAMIAAIYEDELKKQGIDPSRLTLGYKFKHPGHDFSIVHVDTEQSKNLNYKRRRQLYGMITGNMSSRPESFLPLYFKGLPMDTKLDYLSDTLEILKKKGRPATLVFLDHLGDFVDDYNDGSQAIRLVNVLDQILTHYDAACLYSFHTNSTSSKMNGHIGSHLNRKNVSEIYLEENEDDIRLVNAKPEKLRDGAKDFSITFKRTKKGGYELGGIDVVNYDDIYDEEEAPKSAGQSLKDVMNQTKSTPKEQLVDQPF